MTDPDIDWLACSIVEVVPGKVGGVPIIKNTRLPVTAITVNYDGGVEPSEIAELFSVSLDAVHEVLRFRQEQLGDSSEDDSAKGQPGETSPQESDMSRHPPEQET
ncbi:MAG: DUF433 domain-containing protein [Janthinobacterium lividum]